MLFSLLFDYDLCYSSLVVPCSFPNAWVRFLLKELERLRDTEQEIQTLQQEVDEDTTEVIPSAM